MSTSGGAVESSTVVAVPNPAVGVDWSFTLTQAGALVAVRCSLVTSAVVANRVPQVQIIDSAGNSLWRVAVSQAMVASTTSALSAAAGVAFAANSGFWSLPIPSGLVVPVGGVVSVHTNALDAGDQWSAVALTFSDR